MQLISGVQRNQGLLTAPSRYLQQDSEIEILRLGQTQSLKAKAGLEIRVTSGILWLTQTGEAEDIILCAGQRWKAERAGKVVLQAVVDKDKAIWTIE